MDNFEQFDVRPDSCLLCCMCERILKNPVQLSCLHNCCGSCFSTAATKSSGGVECSACGTITLAGTVQPNSFIISKVQRYVAIDESRSCGVCKENGRSNTLAVIWCPSCRHSLCEDCIAGHKQYYKTHVTLSLDELSSLEDVCPPSSSDVCAIHDRPLEIVCFDCEQAKCSHCCSECFRKKHDICSVGDKSFNAYVDKCIALISSMKKEVSSQQSGVLEKPKSALEDLRAARTNELEQISQRKRRILDAVECTFHEIEFATKNLYDNLEVEIHDASAVAERVASSCSVASSYIDRLFGSRDKENLCHIVNQQKIVAERLKVLSGELRAVIDTLGALRAVKIDSSLPEDPESIIKSWIGMPNLCTALAEAPDVPHSQRHFSFGEVSARIRVPTCDDFALTKEGRLLLAARMNGMIEYCTVSGQEVSTWMPPKWAIYHDDSVVAVETLSDGRVAVSTEIGKRVMLIKRNEKHDRGAEENAAEWTLDSSIVHLQWRPCFLAAHGDVIAVTDYIGMARLDRPEYFRTPLLLLSAVGMQPLSPERTRKYRLMCMGITQHAVITASLDEVKLSDGREAHVLDAHSVATDMRLWRSELSDGESVEVVGADSSGSVLYASMFNAHHRRCRLSTFNLADGSVLRNVLHTLSSIRWRIRRLYVCDRLPTIEQEDYHQQKQQQQHGLTISDPCRHILTALSMDYSRPRKPKHMIMYFGATDE